MLGLAEGKAGLMRLGRIRCPRCGLAFRRREDLMHHEQLVHGTALYDCTACGLGFSSMEDMRAHLKRRHSYSKGD